MSNKCKIVMYHYVRPKESQFPEIRGLEIEGFKRQINYFKANFNFLTASQVLDCIYNNTDLPENSILLTFDDGLKEHYQYVFPFLKKEKVQGLFFPPVKPLEENIVLDVHKIHFILAKCKNTSRLKNEIFRFIRDKKQQFNLLEPEKYYEKLASPNRFDSGEIIFIKRILQRELSLHLRHEIVDYLFQKYVTENETEFSTELYMSKEEINEMIEGGMFFGSHGYSHEWLTNLTNEELTIELEKCTSFYSHLKKNHENWIMCYPYGDYNQFVIEKMIKMGYKLGLTTEVGDAILEKKNAYTLKRYDTNDFPQ